MPESAWVFIGLGVLILGVLGGALLWNWKALMSERRINREGQEVLGWCVSVAPNLFRKKASDDDISGWVGVLIAVDRKVGYDVDFMRGLIDRCLELMNRKPTPKEKKLAAELKDSEARTGVWQPLPEAWTDGAEVYYTLVELFRGALHKGKLKFRYVRLKVILDEPDVGANHLSYHKNDEDDAPHHPSRKRRQQDEE